MNYIAISAKVFCYIVCVCCILTIAFTGPADARQLTPEQVWNPKGKRHSKEPYKILFFGDSLFAGYGFPEPDQSSISAILVSKYVDEMHSDREIIVHNMAHNGETTSTAIARIKQAIALKPDIIVLGLGLNDARKQVDPDIIYNNLSIVLQDLNRAGIYTLFVAMQSPLSNGYDYVSNFNGLYDKLAQQNKRVVFFPDLFLGVIEDRMLMQRDGIHPNAEGVDIIAERLSEKLTKMAYAIRKQKHYMDGQQRMRAFMLKANESKKKQGLPPVYSEEQIRNPTSYKPDY